MSVALHDAIVAKLRARFKELFQETPVTVESHEGNVDLATFKRWSTASPGVYVVCLGTEPVKALGDKLPFPEWRFAAFIVTRNTPCEAGEVASGPRGRVGQALATRLIAMIQGETWGVAQAATTIKADNRSTPALAQHAGVNLWVVTWQQQKTLTPDELAATERYIRNPRPLEGVDTRLNPSAPPPNGEDALVTDEVSFDP